TRSKRDWSSDVCSSDLDDEHLMLNGVTMFERIERPLLSFYYHRNGALFTAIVLAHLPKVIHECRIQFAIIHLAQRPPLIGILFLGSLVWRPLEIKKLADFHEFIPKYFINVVGLLTWGSRLVSTG